MKLRRIALSRSGDKGNVANVSVIALDERDYPFLVQHVTVARVIAHLAAFAPGDVVRYECPEIGALNFVLYGALAGGVTRSLALDAHGKSLGTIMLALDLPDRDDPASHPERGR